MANLQDLINLSSVDGGKFFVLDADGNVKLVILPVEEYERLLLGRLQQQVQDIEDINKEILKVQLQEYEVPKADASIETPKPERQPIQRNWVDLREEVIDPSFDFEGPKINFDDI